MSYQASELLLGTHEKLGILPGVVTENIRLGEICVIKLLQESVQNTFSCGGDLNFFSHAKIEKAKKSCYKNTMSCVKVRLKTSVRAKKNLNDKEAMKEISNIFSINHYNKAWS